MSTTTKIVTGVDYVGIPSNDLDTAREFYATVLGLEASSVWQRPGAEFETGTVTIALINCPGLGIPFSPNPAPLALQVDDVQAARAELESRGVTFAADTIDSGSSYHSAWVANEVGGRSSVTRSSTSWFASRRVW